MNRSEIEKKLLEKLTANKANSWLIPIPWLEVLSYEELVEMANEYKIRTEVPQEQGRDKGENKNV